jgi:hypothetical protein
MSKVFFEMKVLDKDLNVKYIVPEDEVRDRHVAAVIKNPEHFPSGEHGPTKLKIKINKNNDVEIE